MQTLWHDIRYALRTFRQNPGFALIAVLTLASGIGATTIMFSSADATLLRPFAFPNQPRLVVLFERKLAAGITQASVSPGNVIEWRAQAQTLQEVIVMRNRQYTLKSAGPPERFTSYGVSAAFFDALGVKPLLGRTFKPGEDEPGRERVAVLKHSFWQEHFGADPNIIGKQVLLDEQPFEIVGVMPKEFEFPFGGGDLWTPFVIEPEQRQEHNNHYLRALALLKPGATVAQANAELQTISQRLQQQFPKGEAGHEAFAVTLNDEYTRVAKMYVPIMAGAALFVLLIACSNVANLLLARGAARQKEMAVRLALGATRWRIIRQLLTESVLLALAGGLLGALLASWGIEALIRGIPPAMSKFIPGWSNLGLSYSVLAFTALIALLTGVLCGLAPAWQAAKANLNETLKEGGGKGAGGAGARSPLRSALVVAEVALSLVLLVGAGLLVRSFIHLLHTDLGVKPASVVTMQVNLPRDQYTTNQARRDFFEQLLQRIAALPGVQKAGAVHALPMGGSNDGNSFQLVGQPAFESGKEPHTDFRIATPEYFAAIGTELRQGRLFNAQDDTQAPRVVLVNEAFASRFLPGQAALGNRMTLGNNTAQPLEIIGVVANVMNDDLDDLAEPGIYMPFAQYPTQALSLVVRAPNAESQIVPGARRELAALDATLPLTTVKPLAEIIHERRSPKEVMMWMLVCFGLLALALAAVGTYAVMAYAVTQRTHEFGVRLALGAQTADILKLVLRRGLALVLLGIALGLAGAFALTRALRQFLYGVAATDPLTFGGVALLLAAAALLACYIPARRATRVDPLVALRCE
ncbi:MAG: ABC transporter permease [Acidobacteria bacterium]|nr:ABC transporter permease [Acidobacteriota bacterium]MBI3423521.1 ABC transporter permease [Acidobacteriota bacterium]